MSDEGKCWCGEVVLHPFSESYLRCDRCETLVYRKGPPPGLVEVGDAAGDLYGKSYWFAHQTVDLGYPDLIERQRMDLVERAPHWLRTVLKYKVPPGRVLEIGSGTACLLALLSSAGFEATGIELSPWVVEQSARSFGVEVLRGTVESLDLEKASYDVIVMMDVLEHLAEPLATLRRCVDLLEPDGVMILQTPCYREGASFEELSEARSPFLPLLVAPEHLFLFSRSSISDLLARAGLTAMVFEEAVYPEHDMYLAVGREQLQPRSCEEIDAALASSPGGRMVRALLDTIDQVHSLESVRARLRGELAEAERAAAQRGELLSDADRELRELTRKAAMFEAAAAQRDEQLVAADRELRELAQKAAAFEAAAADRLASLVAAEQLLRDAEQVHERCRVLEAAASERLDVIQRLDGERRDFEVAAAQRLAALERTEADRLALAGEVERIRAALELRDRRVWDLERALDRANVDLERAARELRDREGGLVGALRRRFGSAGRRADRER